jgi:hypothetical protein
MGQRLTATRRRDRFKQAYSFRQGNWHRGERPEIQQKVRGRIRVTERGNPIGYRHLQEITILMLATTTLSVTRTVVGVGIVQIMYTFESA